MPAVNLTMSTLAARMCRSTDELDEGTPHDRHVAIRETR